MRRPRRRFAQALGWLLALLALTSAGNAIAGSLRYCDKPPPVSAKQKDRILRTSDAVKAELERSGQSAVLLSRSGLNLRRFQQRYSHAGFSLRSNTEVPWAVRQLYYACDEKRPRIFDQGISGFLLGTDDPNEGYVSAVFLPEAAAAALEQVALDKQQALNLLSPSYSANAYPFSLLYQNCNQWALEVLAAALGAPTSALATEEARGSAQRWLLEKSYAPSEFRVSHALQWAGHFVKWVHRDDHPQENVARRRYLVTMPASIETFIRDNLPGATRVEFCHNAQHIVIHRGWDAIADHCTPAGQDTVIKLD